jgi:hypothetical protein
MTIKLIIPFFMAILFHFPYAKGSTMMSTKAKGIIKNTANQAIIKHTV